MDRSWVPEIPCVEPEALLSLVRSHRVVAVQFCAAGSGICVALDRRLAMLRAEFGNAVRFASLDVKGRGGQSIASTVPIRALPTVLVWRAGVLREQVIGLRSPAFYRQLLTAVLVPADGEQL